MQTRGPGLALPFQIKVKWHKQWRSLFCKSAVRQYCVLTLNVPMFKANCQATKSKMEVNVNLLTNRHFILSPSSAILKKTLLSTLLYTLFRDWTEHKSNVCFLHFCMSVFHGKLHSGWYWGWGWQYLIKRALKHESTVALNHVCMSTIKCAHPYLIIGWEGKSLKNGTSQVRFKVLGW